MEKRDLYDKNRNKLGIVINKDDVIPDGCYILVVLIIMQNNIGKFLSVTPGLTGYWAANGRSDTDYDERVKLEIYYVDHCSFWLDIKVLFGKRVKELRSK